MIKPEHEYSFFLSFMPSEVREIPGFYYDPERNRYFRIGTGGPALRDRVRSAQREAEKKADKQKLEKSKWRTPYSVDDASLKDLLRKQPIFNNVRSTIVKRAATRALLRQLKADSQTIIPTNSYITTTGPTAFQDGEAVVTFANNDLLWLGYQCEPFFHVWKASQCWLPAPGDIVAIDLSKRFQYGDHALRTLVGLSNVHGRRTYGRLWQTTLPSLGLLDETEMQKLRETRPNKSTSGCKRGYIGELPRFMQTDPPLNDVDAKWAGVLFHCLDVQKELDAILLGSETGLHYMNRAFEQHRHIKTSKGVMSVKVATRNMFCAGLRDGRLFIYDSRRKDSNVSMSIPHSKSAIAHLAPLGKVTFENQVLIVDVQGKIAIWDTRYRKREPVRILRGHEGAPTVAFDVNMQTNMVVVSGADNRLRLWSLDYDRIMDHDIPLWESSNFDGPVRSCKLLQQPPEPSSFWSFDIQPDDSYRRAPGIIASAPVNGKPAIHWFTVPA